MTATQHDKEEHVYSEMLEQQILEQLDKDSKAAKSIDGLSGEEEELAINGDDDKFDSEPF